MEIVLGLATILGGIAAAWYFIDKYRSRNTSSEADSGLSETKQTNIAEKTINSTWWESSNLKTKLEAEGFKKFYWSDADRVEERKDSGYETVYDDQSDPTSKVILVNKSGQYLLGKKDA